MHRGIFITGTDTGVGKTFVAVGLLRALREKGLDVCPMKPIETGCKKTKGKLIPQDTIRLIRASGVKEPIDLINPYRFKHPLAPSVAAELEGVVIRKKKILSAYDYLLNKYELIVMEGAGGIMVPVYKKYLIIDLVKDLNVPIIIVSRPCLGTINHTLLTIEAAKKRGIKILGIIINYATRTKTGIAEKTNPEIIERLGGVPVLGIVLYSKNQKIVEKAFLGIREKILKELKQKG